METQNIAQVKRDIKNDNITFESAGGLAFSNYSERKEKKIDSIQKIYGINYSSTGCIIDFKEIKAREKYDELADIYLEKRNGKNWKKEMKSKIDKIKTDYR